ncbi:hypothetical protein N806_29665 [Rhodococcus sp. P27]|nr:hypothetical protein N806_29665 [Rhodococcus sp. P27]
MCLGSKASALGLGVLHSDFTIQQSREATMIKGIKPLRIIWGADKDTTGRDLALVVFRNRSFEYIPHNEFALA